MLISKGMACTVMQSFLMSLKTNQGASGILLCVGAQPSDATVDALTATTPLASSVTATYNTSGCSTRCSTLLSFRRAMC